MEELYMLVDLNDNPITLEWEDYSLNVWADLKDIHTAKVYDDLYDAEFDLEMSDEKNNNDVKIKFPLKIVKIKQYREVIK